MPLPPAELANGYDLLVWMDSDGEVLTRSYTPLGEVVLKAMLKGYKPGDVLEILVSPDEFHQDVPPQTRVGYVDPRTNKVYAMKRQHLH
jgi:ribosomal protein L21E